MYQVLFSASKTKFFGLQSDLFDLSCKDLGAINTSHHIIGFISQDEIKGNFFTFTPGIHANNQTDNYGQTYRKIDDLPQNSFAIVGRHIYESYDPTETAKLYVKN